MKKVIFLLTFISLGLVACGKKTKIEKDSPDVAVTVASKKMVIEDLKGNSKFRVKSLENIDTDVKKKVGDKKVDCAFSLKTKENADLSLQMDNDQKSIDVGGEDFKLNLKRKSTGKLLSGEWTSSSGELTDKDGKTEHKITIKKKKSDSYELTWTKTCSKKMVIKKN